MSGPDTGAARLRIVPARTWSAVERSAVEAEGAALLGFLEPALSPSVEIIVSEADSRIRLGTVDGPV
ncbi:hypothetical protein [Nocardia vaccinii]|uniref:hypothetical protein n=1 Tax=Nocardia vaccinii TaxID=1822 RepID=UPI000833333B|nr:hypothetical protein [Nocardia vaccinii]